MRSRHNALKNLDGTQSDQNSCFRVNISEIAGGIYIVGLEHPEEIHQATV